MTSPRVLVLLASFNGAKWVKQQIDSILSQRGVSITIVVADDGSTDATVSILKKGASNRITVSENKMPTGSAAQNFLSLIRSTGAEGYDYVSFSDQDDIWEPTRLAKACAMLEAGLCSGYSSSTIAFWPTGRQRILKQDPTPTRSDFLFEGAGQGCTYVLKCDFYTRVRAFTLGRRHLTDGLHYHDWALYTLARAWNLAWIFDECATIRYRQHELNDTGAKLSIRGAANRLNQIANGWYRNQIIAVSKLAKEANSSDPRIDEWLHLVTSRDSLRRRLHVVRFCLSGGRRKMTDNIVLIGAAFAGWI